MMEINSNNHHNFAPFYWDDKRAECVVDPEWWSAVHSSVRTIDVPMRFELIPRPHSNRGENGDPVYLPLYRAFVDSYSFQHWMHVLDRPVELIPISPQNQKGFLKMCRIFQCGRGEYPIKVRHLDDFSDDFIDEIEKTIAKIDRGLGVFVKTSQTSGKTDLTLKPCFNVLDVFSQLVYSQKVYSTTEKYGSNLHLVFQPWNPEISEQNEYRVFWFENRVVAISQQSCYRKVDLNPKIEVSVEAICTLFSDGERGLLKIPYREAVIDVYVDRSNKAHIIEINPGGLWCSSGSSLFHWIRDYDILHSTTCSPVVRIL